MAEPAPAAASASASTPAAAVSATSPTAAKQTGPSIPVGLGEAALDSPTFRATAVHFSDQVDGIERWLESYVKSTSRLVHDILGLEDTINNYLSKMIPAPAVIDGVIDNDYTLLALKRVGDGSREWWTQLLGSLRRMDSISADPIRNFINGELRAFKDARKALEQSQKTFDSTLARYVGQSKTKEPSALREDAFAVYETRRAYLKASMDYCQMAPQLRYTLDKLLVRVCADVWKDWKRSREIASGPAKWGEEMERIRGWSKNLETSEPALRRELQIARRVIGESTLAAYKPSRELDDYSASTVPFLGSRGPVNVRSGDQAAAVSEKQGWLFLRTISGKPARVNWVRRWFYCRDGIFGWLVQGPQGVLQGDEIGVLLCSAKPAVQEERRFCFEVKTKSQNLLLQAETQTQLTEWLEVFEVAKKQAFEASMSRDSTSLPGGIDPAFAITPPPIPEFSAKSIDAASGVAGDDGAATALDRTGTLPVPGPDGGLASRTSFDVSGTIPRRSATTFVREEGESSREHAARIMQKLDLHRKATLAVGGAEAASAAPPPTPSGIASLISASHNLLPSYMGYGPSTPNLTSSPRPGPTALLPAIEPRPGSLAPATFAKPPATTVLSKAAVVVSGERVMGTGSTRILPTAILANYWGSHPWAAAYASRNDSVQATGAANENDSVKSPTQSISPGTLEPAKTALGTVSQHRKTVSVDAKVAADNTRAQDRVTPEEFPANYPPELKAQHAQFRLLFPAVPLDEKLVLVFNAAWESSQKEGSTAPALMGHGRIYVSPDNMYFYGQSMGLVIAYTISLDIITEVTSAAGRECDYIFLHLAQDANDTGFTRITIKTFLEDMGLLHARLNLLIDDLQAEEPMDVSEIITALVNLEREEYEKKSPSVESWEEVSAYTPIDDGTPLGRPAPRRVQDIGSRKKIPRKPVPKFQLPAHPVIYEPEDMQRRVAERHFEISAKACFHVLFGDKSFIFPKLYFERRAKEIAQGPWERVEGGNGKMKRQFKFQVDHVDMLGRRKPWDITDEQTIDVFSDHVTYVVTHVRTPWHLPHSQGFKLVIKVVITHVAKSKCKLAIYTRVDWSNAPTFSKSMVERQALDDTARDAEELAEVATDQVRKLGPHSRTKRAIQVYGNIGDQKQTVVFTPSENDAARKPPVRPRTLMDMLLETARSFMESVASSLMMWAFAGFKKLFDVATANRVILAVLAVSVAANVIFTSKDGSVWWAERRAASFMSRIGVGPNILMSKAIYIADLEEAAQGASGGNMAHAMPQGSVCYDTFRSIMNMTDMDSPYQDAGATLSLAPSRARARRLRRTRQKLGSYRHDLLVAMRMVNSIEREMVQTEWENWLADENVRCEQVRLVLEDRNQTSTKGGGSSSSAVQKKTMQQQQQQQQLDDEKAERLRKFDEEYCGSCRADQRELEDDPWERRSFVSA